MPDSNPAYEWDDEDDDEIMVASVKRAVVERVGDEELAPSREIALRFEDDDEGALAPFSFLSVEEIEGAQERFNEAQRIFVTQDIPVSCTKIFDADTYKFPYLPASFFKDFLNKFCRYNWHMDYNEEERQHPLTHKWEVHVSGHLVLFDKSPEPIKIKARGGALFKNSSSQTSADVYKAAESDMIKNGCKKIGIGLQYESDYHKQKALTYHGQQKETKNLNNLRAALGDCKKEDVPKALEEKGVEFEPWYLESQVMVERLEKEVRRKA